MSQALWKNVENRHDVWVFEVRALHDGLLFTAAVACLGHFEDVFLEILVFVQACEAMWYFWKVDGEANE